MKQIRMGSLATVAMLTAVEEDAWFIDGMEKATCQTTDAPLSSMVNPPFRIQDRPLTYRYDTARLYHRGVHPSSAYK